MEGQFRLNSVIFRNAVCRSIDTEENRVIP